MHSLLIAVYGKLFSQPRQRSLLLVAQTPSPAQAPYIVFYDGECGLCQRSVRWLLDHDPYQRLVFAPLQGATAARLRAALVPLPQQLESVAVLIQTEAGRRVLLRTEALLALCEILELRPWWARLLRSVPRWFADLGYRLVAHTRYRVFGRATICPWRDASEAQRFLD
ncbi:MAG: DUF393 domain-containing protein [Candidatus Binatia bacterium]|nr:DUF393 domain-containing protein [Candidatus Binatia bacterium]